MEGYSTSSAEIDDLKEQLMELQLEIDILKETINVLKKDPGVDQTALKNREKAVIIGALKNKYAPPVLLDKLSMARSRYFYQIKAMSSTEKYHELRSKIRKIFDENKERFGYRRIHAILKNQGTIVSEKVIRRIMREESLTVRIKKRLTRNLSVNLLPP